MGITQPTPPGIASLVFPTPSGATGVGNTPTLSWAAGSGDPTGYDVYFGTSLPLEGSPNVSHNTQTTTTWSPGTLAYSTTYHWKIVPWNDIGSAGFASCPTWTFTTMADPNIITTFPWTDGFETGNTDQTAIAGWTQESVTWVPDVWTANSSQTDYNRAPRSGSWNACLRWGNTDWMFKPFVFEAGVAYEASLFARQDGANAAKASIAIAYGTEATAAGMTNSILPATGIINGDYQYLNGEFTVPTTGTYFVGILGNITTGSWYISLDDIKVDLAPEAIFNISPNVASFNFGNFPVGAFAERVFTISNTGTADLNLGSIGIDPAGTDFSIPDYADIDWIVAPGENTQFTVRFEPQDLGTQNADLNIVFTREDYSIALSGSASGPASLPLTEGWEAGQGNWSIVNGNQTNAWYIGTAGPHAGSKSAYISNNGGVTNAYEPFSYSVVHLYTDIAFSADKWEFPLSFWWKCQGEGSYSDYDYLRVFVVDTSVTPVAGTALTTGQVGDTYNMLGTAWQQANITLPGTLSGTVKRLVFSWRNDDSWGNQPPINIDDISLTSVDSPEFVYSPDTINFGTVFSDALPGPQIVTISNNGGGELAINSSNISISGADAAGFGFSAENLPTSLSSGESVEIPVFLTGLSDGAISATLTITYDSVDYDVALNANVLEIVTIGNGTADNMIPVYPYFGYTYSQSIFLQSEINMADKRIEKISYYWNGAGTGTNTNSWTVYMGHTSAEAFASTTDWLPRASLTQVFSGTIALPAEAGWIEIPLTIPFVYNNMDNLVIAVDENAPGYDNSSCFFYSTAVTGNRSLSYYSDNTNPDPAAPVDGTLVAAYPNVMLQLGKLPTEPILTVTPNSWDFGTKQINTTTTKQFTIANTGAGTLSVSGVNVTGTGFALADAFTPVSLAPTESTTFTVNFTPTTVATYSGNIAINDNRAVTNIPLTGAAIDASIYSGDLPYDTGFEDTWTGSPAAPEPGWTVINANGDSYTWRRGRTYINAHTGDWFAQGMGNTDDWMITPPLNTGSHLKLKWWDAVESESFPNSYKVLLSTTDTNPASFTTELADITCSSTTWTEHDVTFANTSGTAYVAFYQYASSSSSWDFGIDDLVIEEDPNITSFPYLEDFEAHADNTLPLGWTRSSLAAGWVVGDDLSSDYFNIPTHTVYAAANDDAGGSGADGSMDILTMPKIDLSGATPGVPILGFDSFYTAEYGQLASIEASTDSINWVSIYAVEEDDAWTTQSVLLTNYMGNAEVYLRFHADDNGTWAGGWAIDNVSISYSTEDTFPPTIAHLPEIGSLLADTPIPIVAEIADSPVLSSGIASAKLFYSTDASTYTEIAMINTEGALYAAAIPGQALGTTISYYIEAVDGAATPNTTTTDVWDFEINDPVTLQYDSGNVTTVLGSDIGTFGMMTGFPNPLGAGNYLQINSVSAGMSNAGTANVHVFTYDSEAGVLVDVIPPFSQSFAAGVHLDIPLTNCVTNAEYFYVAFTDVVAPNYIQFDDTQDYYPETHYIIIGAGADISNMVSVEGYGIPGSWLIRANVEPAAISLDTPAVNLAQGSTGVDLSWAAVDGAATYQIYGSDDPYAADPWELVASVTSPAYTYTGTELSKFFKVVAKNDLIISSASHTKLGNIRTNPKVRLQKMNIKGKRK